MRVRVQVQAQAPEREPVERPPTAPAPTPLTQRRPLSSSRPRKSTPPIRAPVASSVRGPPPPGVSIGVSGKPLETARCVRPRRRHRPMRRRRRRRRAPDSAGRPNVATRVRKRDGWMEGEGGSWWNRWNRFQWCSRRHQPDALPESRRSHSQGRTQPQREIFRKSHTTAAGSPKDPGHRRALRLTPFDALDTVFTVRDAREIPIRKPRQGLVSSHGPGPWNLSPDRA